MKNNLFMCLLIAVCVTVFVGCTPPNRPSTMEIRGIITDENGQPLQSIFVCIDTTYLAELMTYDDGIFSNQEGIYKLLYMKGYPSAFMGDWPSELVMIAKDTSGIYWSQKKSFPVDVRYSDWNKNYSYAFVTADFVMKKKK